MTFEKPLEVSQNIKKKISEHTVTQFIFLFWKLYIIEVAKYESVSITFVY